MIATIVSLLTSLPVLVTLVMSVAKLAPKLFVLLGKLFKFGGGMVGGGVLTKLGCAGSILSILSFFGGLGVFIIIGFNFSLEKLNFVIDWLMSPIFSILNKFLAMVLSSAGGCPAIPNAFAIFLSLINIPVLFSVITVSIGCEIFLRLMIKALIDNTLRSKK